MKFESKLLNIKAKLENKTKDRNTLYVNYVSERLTKSLISYRQDLEYSIRYLNNRKPENVLKRMTDE